MSTTPRRFAILHHTGYGREHWDLLLEQDETLFTWQLGSCPASDQNFPIDAARIADHRKIYLDYEGPVSGARGHVTAVDRGKLTMISQDPQRIEFELEGESVAGRFVLTQVSESVWRLAQPSSSQYG